MSARRVPSASNEYRVCSRSTFDFDFTKRPPRTLGGLFVPLAGLLYGGRQRLAQGHERVALRFDLLEQRR